MAIADLHYDENRFNYQNAKTNKQKQFCARQKVKKNTCSRVKVIHTPQGGTEKKIHARRNAGNIMQNRYSALHTCFSMDIYEYMLDFLLLSRNI